MCLRTCVKRPLNAWNTIEARKKTQPNPKFKLPWLAYLYVARMRHRIIACHVKYYIWRAIEHLFVCVSEWAINLYDLFSVTREWSI